VPDGLQASKVGLGKVALANVMSAPFPSMADLLSSLLFTHFCFPPFLPVTYSLPSLPDYSFSCPRLFFWRNNTRYEFWRSYWKKLRAGSWDRVFLCSSGWIKYSPPASVSWVLSGLQRSYWNCIFVTRDKFIQLPIRYRNTGRTIPSNAIFKLKILDIGLYPRKLDLTKL
jgi:hypothetical protein